MPLSYLTFREYMWINFYILIFIFTIIFVAKFIQYFRRWGESKTNNIEYSEKTMEIILNNQSFVVDVRHLVKKYTQGTKKILLFTPFYVSEKKYQYFATALALKNYEIFLIGSFSTLRQLRNNYISARGVFSEIVNQINPQIIISADILFPYLLLEMQRNSGIIYVFLRPIIAERELSFYQAQIFSIPLFSYFSTIWNKPTNILSDSVVSPIACKVLCIFPKFFQPVFSRMVIKKNLTLVYIRSRLSFHYKESLIFTRILQFIETVSS